MLMAIMADRHVKKALDPSQAVPEDRYSYMIKFI